MPPCLGLNVKGDFGVTEEVGKFVEPVVGEEVGVGADQGEGEEVGWAGLEGGWFGVLFGWWECEILRAEMEDGVDVAWEEMWSKVVGTLTQRHLGPPTSDPPARSLSNSFNEGYHRHANSRNQPLANVVHTLSNASQYASPSLSGGSRPGKRYLSKAIAMHSSLTSLFCTENGAASNRDLERRALEGSFLKRK